MAEDAPKEQQFNLNTWKSTYQNNKNKPEVAFEWLWKNFDPENWCVNSEHATCAAMTVSALACSDVKLPRPDLASSSLRKLPDCWRPSVW